MVFYSIKSGAKVFHLPHCKILRRIQKEYKRQFETPEEARQAGYRLCSCCSPVGMRLRREQKAVNQFCQENGISCRLEDGQLLIRTPMSKWRVIATGKSNKLFLYHKNTYEKHEKIPSIVPGYHSQAVRSKTIIGYLDYIVQHDAFRKQERKKAKRQAASHPQQYRKVWPNHRGIRKCRYNAGQLHSFLDR